ncbi:MAG: transposase [Waddliaceae bacterium]|nr:transposase [Waddliaceae bacterium]MBT3578565.1 transposase [Waddliaceae bacterium]MBT4444710.1 transposase [Waddliaceae bacterium]MBT6928691.1 transposase [Waddliaceae bacterium]MBT7264923.1 transposase [Waddliaceae bacterium]
MLDQAIVIFCICDEASKSLNIKDDSQCKMSTAEVMTLKGRSSRKIQQEFPGLCKRYWGKHFWGIGYAAFSAGEVTDKTIKEYIENHSSDDEMFTVE